MLSLCNYSKSDINEDRITIAIYLTLSSRISESGSSFTFKENHRVSIVIGDELNKRMSSILMFNQVE